MTENDSTDRRPTEYVLFALAFGGFVLAATGVVLSSIALAVFGGLLMIGSISCFLAAA